MFVSRNLDRACMIHRNAGGEKETKREREGVGSFIVFDIIKWLIPCFCALIIQFRANVKANILSGNQLLVFGYGYRANYPIENDIKVRRRDVYDSIEELIDQ